MIGEPEPGIVRIAEYDEAWLLRFEAERERISAALGDSALRIEHIGSTAVPGLAAKPIVDVLVAVQAVDDETRYRLQLEASGYVLRVREPGHRMFRTVAKDVHVHLWDSPAEIERHLRFRDRLVRDEADRRLYERTKRELAKRVWPDRDAYARAKDDVIAAIMKRSNAESP